MPSPLTGEDAWKCEHEWKCAVRWKADHYETAPAADLRRACARPGPIVSRHICEIPRRSRIAKDIEDLITRGVIKRDGDYLRSTGKRCKIAEKYVLPDGPEVGATFRFTDTARAFRESVPNSDLTNYYREDAKDLVSAMRLQAHGEASGDLRDPTATEAINRVDSDTETPSLATKAQRLFDHVMPEYRWTDARQLIVMHYRDKISLDECARVLGVSPSTIDRKLVSLRRDLCILDLPEHDWVEIGRPSTKDQEPPDEVTLGVPTRQVEDKELAKVHRRQAIDGSLRIYLDTKWSRRKRHRGRIMLTPPSGHQWQDSIRHLPITDIAELVELDLDGVVTVVDSGRAAHASRILLGRGWLGSPEEESEAQRSLREADQAGAYFDIDTVPYVEAVEAA